MCGIVGLFFNNKNINKRYIQNMANSIRHRGPDDEGYIFFDKNTVHAVGGKDTKQNNYGLKYAYSPSYNISELKKSFGYSFGHRRLSIIDLSPAGHQPMCTKDKKIWITYNGEIYNYLELKDELIGKGYQFQSNSDTEVLLNSYAEWGTECLNKLNGMWAFVIYDQRKQYLFGARDRFSVKPLYYFNNANCFAFGSEIKALLTLPFINMNINDNALFDYLLLYREESEEEGFFKDIFELKPSHAFIFDLTNFKLNKYKYYNLQYNDKWERYNKKSYFEFSSNLKNHIIDAVKIRLRSDVPIGSCLSGGLDSSSLVCLINDLLQHEHITQIGSKQKVFTASYHDTSIDESKWAEIVVKNTNTKWFQTFPTEDQLIQDIEKLVYIQDIPFGTTSIYAQYQVMKLASMNGIKVLIDGRGGDELFAGYNPYYRAFFSQIIKRFDLITLLKEFINLNNSPVTRQFLLSSLIQTAGSKLVPMFISKNYLIKRRVEYKYINKDFIYSKKNRLESIYERSFTSLNKMLFDTMTEFGLKTLLRYEDRNAMNFSIEARTPFADDIFLINYIFNIPSTYKIHNGWSKYIFREAMSGILPESIKWRKDKIGFITPETIWLNSKRNYLKQYLTNDLNEFINIKKLLSDIENTPEDRPIYEISHMWRIFNFAIWKRVYQNLNY